MILEVTMVGVGGDRLTVTRPIRRWQEQHRRGPGDGEQWLCTVGGHEQGTDFGPQFPTNAAMAVGGVS